MTTSCDVRRRANSRFIVRLAALPTDATTTLCMVTLDTAIAAIQRLDAEVASLRTEVSDRLAHVIGTIDERQTRNQLIALRRDLFNERISRVREIAGGLRGAAEPVERFIRTIECRNIKISELRSVACDAFMKARDHFKEAVAQPEFLKGLLLASPTLYHSVVRYSTIDTNHATSRAEQVERGVLRYFTRASMKATPFGRFCAVVPGYIGGDAGARQPIAIVGDPTARRGYVRLNKSLYAPLWHHLKRRPAVRRRLITELNPTVQTYEGGLSFLAGAGKNESFQRMPLNAALQYVVDTARSRRLEFGALVMALAHDPAVDASDTQAAAYLDALIDRGLLRLRSVVPELEPEWDRPLREFLSGTADQQACRAAALLTQLRGIATVFANAAVEERAAYSAEAAELVRCCFNDMGIPVEMDRGAPLFEDMTANAAIQLAPTTGLKEALGDLAEYIDLTTRIAHRRFDQATMRVFFDRAFGDRRSVPVLEFYETYYRSHYREFRDRIVEGSIGGRERFNPFGISVLDELSVAFARLTKLVQDRWAAAPDAEEIILWRSDLEAVIGPISHGADDCHSAAVFVQVARPSGARTQTKLVMSSGQWTMGYGKFYSRFMHLFPEEFRDGVVSDNVALSDECDLAEIACDAHYNANLHPSLLDHAIIYPTGDADGRGSIACGELDVFRHPLDPYALCLVSRATGRRVIPIDLGILNPMARPPLFQLLSKFTPAPGFQFPIPDSVDQSRPQSNPGLASLNPNSPRHATGAGYDQSATTGVTFRPRVTYQGTVVLARRCWTVPSARLPQRLPSDSEGDYFVRVNRWRVAAGLPAEVYVRVPSLPPAAAQRGEPHLPRTDAHKPQYIDFTNPFIVRLLSRIGGTRSSFTAVFEECLPSRSELPFHAGSAYAYEIVMQLDKRETGISAKS